MASETPDPGIAGLVREQMDRLRRELLERHIIPLVAEVDELKRIVTRARLTRLEDAAFRVMHLEAHVPPLPHALGRNFEACMNAVVLLTVAARAKVEEADVQVVVDETIREINEQLRSHGYSGSMKLV